MGVFVKRIPQPLPFLLRQIGAQRLEVAVLLARCALDLNWCTHGRLQEGVPPTVWRTSMVVCIERGGNAGSRQNPELFERRCDVPRSL
ncbi:MAG: hypothetical protein QOD46_1192 [Actinomycetota bacterium]|nr:hypothetical protein [Actinomycetota bacterium]